MKWRERTRSHSLVLQVSEFYICLLKHAGQRRFEPKQVAYQRNQIDYPQNVKRLMKSAKYKAALFIKSQTSILS